MGPFLCLERCVQTIESNGSESRTTCVEEMHAVSSTPIRSKNDRRRSPRVLQQFIARGSIYSVPLSPNVSPVGKSLGFPAEIPSPARGSKCDRVNGVTSVTPKRDRSCLNERRLNHRVMPTTDESIKKPRILKQMPSVPVAPKSPEYLPLVIVSDGEDSIPTAYPKRAKGKAKDGKSKVAEMGNGSDVEPGRNLSCRRRIMGGERSLRVSRGRRSLILDNPENKRKTAEIIDLVLRGGVGREDIACENEEGSGNDITPKNRRSYSKANGESYRRESSRYQKIQPSEPRGKSLDCESNDGENDSEDEGEYDGEVSIVSDRSEVYRRNQIARVKERYRDNAAFNTSGSRASYSRTRLRECMDTSGPRSNHSRVRPRKCMDTSGPQDNQTRRYGRHMDTSGPVGDGDRSETSVIILRHEDSEEEEDERTRYSHVSRVPKSKFYQSQVQRRFAQVLKNGRIEFGSDGSDHESNNEVSGYVDEELRGRDHSFIQSRNQSYSVQDSFYIGNDTNEQDSSEESFESVKALQIAKGKKGRPKNSIDVVKRNVKPLKTRKEKTTSKDVEHHPPQKKGRGFAANKRTRLESQNHDENDGSQAADSSNPPAVKKRGRSATEGKTVEPKKQIRTKKRKEILNLQVDSSDGADGQKSPVKKKANKAAKNEAPESSDSTESKKKARNPPARGKAAVTEISEIPSKTKRGRKPTKKAGEKGAAKTLKESNEVDSQSSDPTESSSPPKKKRRGKPPGKEVEESIPVNDKSSSRSNESQQGSSGTESDKENSGGSRRRTLFSENASKNELSLNQVQETPLNVSKKSVTERRSSPNSGKRKLQSGSSSDYLRKKVLTMRLGASPFRASTIEENALVVTSTPMKSMSESRSMSRPENKSDKESGSSDQPELGNSNATAYPQPALNVNEKLRNLPSTSASVNPPVKTPVKSSSSKFSVKVMVDGSEKKMDLFADYSKIPFHGRAKGKEECAVHYGAALDVLGLGTGYIHLKPGTEKGYQKTKSHNMVFLILDGEVLVKIHESELYANPGDFFAVPKGCKYNVTATGSRKAVIAYFKSKAE